MISGKRQPASTPENNQIAKKNGSVKLTILAELVQSGNPAAIADTKMAINL